MISCKIYGSEPPSYDTFWKLYEALGAEVFTFPRSSITKSEKQVDTQICSDIVSTAYKYSHAPFPAIVAIGTGDLDLLPSSRLVLKETEFKIEVWSCDHAQLCNMQKHMKE